MQIGDKSDREPLKRNVSPYVICVMIVTLALLAAAYVVSHYRENLAEFRTRSLVSALGGRVMGNARSIQFTGPHITDNTLNEIRQLTETEWLELHSTRVTDHGIKAVAEWSRLRELYLNHNQLSDESLQYVSGLASLERLELIGTEISDAGLSQLRRLTNLRILDLSCTNVSQEGVTSLKAALPNCDVRWSQSGCVQPTAE